MDGRKFQSLSLSVHVSELDTTRTVVDRSVSRAIARACMALCTPKHKQAKLLAHSSSFFMSWAELIAACRDYCQQSGWRFLTPDFDFNSCGKTCTAEALAVRMDCLPCVLDYARRLRSGGDVYRGLIAEFRHCHRLLAEDAAFQIMHKTCGALGLEMDIDEQVDPSDCAYHDMSQPLPLIAARLANFEAALQMGEIARQHRERLLHATFIVDFGVAFGQPAELHDATTTACLREFWQRVNEWGGNSQSSRDVVAALTGLEVQSAPPLEALRRFKLLQVMQQGAVSASRVLEASSTHASRVVGLAVEAADEEIDSMFDDSVHAARAVVGGVMRRMQPFSQSVKRNLSFTKTWGRNSCQEMETPGPI